MFLTFLVVFNLYTLYIVWREAIYTRYYTRLLLRLDTLLAYSKINIGTYRVLLNDIKDARKVEDFNLVDESLKQIESR